MLLVRDSFTVRWSVGGGGEGGRRCVCVCCKPGNEALVCRSVMSIIIGRIH